MKALTLTLRKVTDSDLNFLYKVYASTRYDELEATGWSKAQKDEFLLMQFKAQDQFYKQQFSEASYEIVQCDGQDAGRLYLDKREDEIRIVDIALLPSFRGKGLGSRLLKTIIENAFTDGLAVRIHVEKNNPALTLYQRLGFEEIGDKGVYWLMEKVDDKQAA